MNRKPLFPKTISDCQFTGFQVIKEPHLWQPGSLQPTFSSSPLCSLIHPGLRRGGQSLTASTSLSLSSAFFISQLCQHVTSKGQEKRNNTAQMPTVLSCQGEERREIKANKTSKSKISKSPLWCLAAVKVNTGTWQRGEKASQIKARQLWSLGRTDQARLHFQGRDGRPHRLVYFANIQVVCLDCRGKKKSLSFLRTVPFFFFSLLLCGGLLRFPSLPHLCNQRKSQLREPLPNSRPRGPVSDG